MSFPAPSDISQNDAEILKKQRQEMQQLLAQLEEAVKLHRAECVAQKARREAEAKAKKEGCGAGGEEKEDDGVPPATPRRGAGGKGHPIGGG